MKFDYIPFRLRKDFPPENLRVPGSEFENVESAILALEIRNRIKEITARASAGSPLDANLLAGAAQNSVEVLTALCDERPELFSEFSKKCPQWPVLGSLHPETHRANLELFKKLSLGADAEVSAKSSSRWNRQNIATIYAINVINVIRANQKQMATILAFEKATTKIKWRGKIKPWVLEATKLKPLSRSTAKDWWKVGKQAFLEYRPDPENIQELRIIAQHKYSETDKREQILYLIGRALSSLSTRA